MASAAILMGGRARRFGGRDKSALVVDGRTILERQLAALAPLADDVMLVGAPGARPADAETALDDSDVYSVRVIGDRVPDCGPLGGLDAALAAARHEVLILLACDMPFVTTAFLAHLVGSAAAADAVVPRTERGYHPLCAAYTSGCREAVSRRLACRELEMTQLLRDVRTREVGRGEIERFGSSERLLANVNTPGEFDGLEALLNHEA
jgi:molybdopterin-guanine dinucleotide biosynthesis protein A